MPVFEAVSHATLEKGSCSRHASSYRDTLRWKIMYFIISSTYDCIRDLIANLIFEKSEAAYRKSYKECLPGWPSPTDSLVNKKWPGGSLGRAEPLGTDMMVEKRVMKWGERWDKKEKWLKIFLCRRFQPQLSRHSETYFLYTRANFSDIHTSFRLQNRIIHPLVLLFTG